MRATVLVSSWLFLAAGPGGADEPPSVELPAELQLRARSTQRSETGAGEVHEDIGLLSRDADRGGFVFRQFLSEGGVNTFDVTIDPHEPGLIRFRHRDSEGSGGMRARMRVRLSGAERYDMELDLAEPGKDFVVRRQMRMRRAP